MHFIRDIAAIALLACLQTNIAAARDADWAWIALDSQGAKWAISQGNASVRIDGRKIEIVLLTDSGSRECNITGQFQSGPKAAKANPEMRPLRAQVICYGTEMPESTFAGMLTSVELNAPGSRRSEVIRIDDGINIIALTRET